MDRDRHPDRDLPHHVLIGIHLPKTAGTTLRSAISRVYAPEDIAYLYRSAPGEKPKELVNRLLALKRLQPMAFPRLIYGHMGYGLHGKLGIQARYITVLRHPLPRAISLYRHEVRNPHALHHEQAKRLDIADFFLSNPSPQFRNSMTRMLAGTLWQEETWFVDGDEAELLETAKRNLLAQFAYVGFTENLGDDAERLSGVFGRSIYLGWENRDPEPLAENDLSNVDREIILSCFSLDMELYRFACKTFSYNPESLLHQTGLYK